MRYRRSMRAPVATALLGAGFLAALGACGANATEPRAVVLASPTSASDAGASTPAEHEAPAPDAGAVDTGVRDFAASGARDVEPVDPGVVATSDRSLLETATQRAHACVASAKLVVRLLFRITLADDGTPHAELVRVEGGPLTASVSTCALRALEVGHYTKPGTATPQGPTKRFILVHVDQLPAPQEYQVD